MVTLPWHIPAPSPPATDVADVRAVAARETPKTGPPTPRLPDRARPAFQARHGSRRTENAHVAWIRRHIIFHGTRDAADMGAAEITQFLSSLAVEPLNKRLQPGALGRSWPSRLERGRWVDLSW